MDAEFINAYVQKVTALNQELLNKTLVLEVQLSLAEKKIAELSSESSKKENKKDINKKEDF